KRREDINRFKEDPNCRLFLTTDSGSTGLNLQVANVVINLDLPWNPAKLEQRIARAWRKFQSRTVQVINLVTEDSIEQRMLLTLAMKQAVADAVLDADGEEDLDEMPLPSASREDFIAKLEQLTGQASTYKITPSPENGYQSHERMKEEALARHSDRIHLLEAYPNIVLAVVDKSDPDIKQSLISVSESPVEILDFETYQTMKRLVEAGIMHFGNDEKSVLYRSHLVQAEWQDAQRKKLEQAKAAYSEAERKLKMVVLLKSGCFSSEAMPAACEAFQKGMEALQVLEYTPDAASLALKEQLTVPQDPDAHIDALAIWMNNLSATIAAYALGIDDSSFSMIKEK
ncbi:MAG: helicase-related protein, partial [Parachlamydiaceae bacterium]